jgi:hypothetical protein
LYTFSEVCVMHFPASLRPGVYSASNRNEYRKHKKKLFLESKVRLVRWADNLTITCETIV